MGVEDNAELTKTFTKADVEKVVFEIRRILHLAHGFNITVYKEW